MGIETGIGLIIGVFLIWLGYIFRTQAKSASLVGFWITWTLWEPVNSERLGKRIGVLLITLGLLVLLATIFTIWFGGLVGKISAILALTNIILIFIAIALDQMGR